MLRGFVEITFDVTPITVEYDWHALKIKMDKTAGLK
eukprot:UN17559